MLNEVKRVDNIVNEGNRIVFVCINFALKFI